MVVLNKAPDLRSLWRVAQIARFPLVRFIYFVLGLICLGFVFISWLPGIPTADFVILALFFFARSSRRFEMWLRNHPVFGEDHQELPGRPHCSSQDHRAGGHHRLDRRLGDPFDAATPPCG